MRPQNSLSARPANKPISFSAAITSDAMQNMMNKSVKDPAKVAALASTLIHVVSTNPKLADCKPETVVAAGLRGEIGMGLSVSLGQYSIIPYGDKATFQLQAKGLKQMAIRSGKYDVLTICDVREGEYLGRDPKTREPIFKWIDDDDEREELPIVGYYGYYKLNKENSGFSNSIYWSHKRILKHADRYSNAFSLEKYNKILAGELSPDEVAKLQGGSPWYSLPTDTAHMKMCEKTIAIQLLGDGLAPLDTMVRDAIRDEGANDPVFSTGDTPVVPAAPVNVDSNTGEIVDAEYENVPENQEEPAPASAPKGRKPSAKQEAAIDSIIGG